MDCLGVLPTFFGVLFSVLTGLSKKSAILSAVSFGGLKRFPLLDEEGLISAKGFTVGLFRASSARLVQGLLVTNLGIIFSFLQPGVLTEAMFSFLLAGVFAEVLESFVGDTDPSLAASFTLRDDVFRGLLSRSF